MPGEPPLEIWENIVSFLESYEANGLFQTCRITRSIGLGQQFATFMCPPTTTVERILAGSVEWKELYASLVKTLEFTPEHHLFWETSSKAGRRWRLRLRRPRPPITTALPDFIGLMKNARTLRLGSKWVPGDSTAAFVRRGARVLDPGWSTFGRTLRHLDLSVHIESLHLLLPPTGLHLEELEHLTYKVSRAYVTTDVVPLLLSTVIPFINGHSGGLTSFSLITSPDYILPICTILHELSPMPRLRSLELSFVYTNTTKTTLSSIHRFLSFHTPTLQELSLSVVPSDLEHPIPPSVWDEELPWGPGEHAPVPHLRHITLTLPHLYPPSFDFAALRYATCLNSSSRLNMAKSLLTSLKLTKPVWPIVTLAEMAQLLGSLQTLRHLDLVIPTLESDVIRILAYHLPRLETLRLEFYWFQEDNLYESEATRVERFSTNIRGDSEEFAVYAEWEVSSLWVVIDSLMRVSDPNELLQECEHALLRALPKVRYLNGLSRGSYDLSSAPSI